MEALRCEMTHFQDYLCNDPTERFLQPNPLTAMHAICTLWVYIPTHLHLPPPFLLTLNQSPKEIARNDIINCLTYYTMYAIAFKAARRVIQILEVWADIKLCHVFLKTSLFQPFFTALPVVWGCATYKGDISTVTSRKLTIAVKLPMVTHHSHLAPSPSIALVVCAICGFQLQVMYSCEFPGIFSK